MKRNPISLFRVCDIADRCGAELVYTDDLGVCYFRNRGGEWKDVSSQRGTLLRSKVLELLAFFKK